MKEKLLITSSTFPRYSEDTTPSFIYDYSIELSKYFEVIVLCPFASGSKSFENMEEIKVYRYKYLPFNPGTLAYNGGIGPRLKQNPLNYLQVPFFLFFQLLNIIKLVKKHDIKIIHAHWVIPQGLLAVIYKLFFNKKIKILTTAHGADIYSMKGILPNVLKQFTIKNADKITCVSNALKNEALRLYPKENIEVIPMGINTDLFSAEKYTPEIKTRFGINNKFLLFAGRLVEKKGLEYLLLAMPEVLRQFPDTKLLVVGDGPEKNSLKTLAKKLNIEKNIIFAGSIEHKKLPEYFAAADIFIGPSVQASGGDSEGFGLVFAEALSCKTPVITTDLPAIADIVQNNINGFAVEQKNSKELAKKIIFLLKNPDKIKEMGEAGRKFVSANFDWKIVSEKYKNLIKAY